jgi:hypothetical protein
LNFSVVLLHQNKSLIFVSFFLWYYL